MNKPSKAMALLLAFFIFPLISNAQQVNFDKKEIGVNFRNLWFGSTAEILMRKPMGDNQFKRRTFRVSGNLNEVNNSFTGSSYPGLPEYFKSNSNGSINVSIEMGREKRVSLFENVYYYHGPAITFGGGMVTARSASGGGQYPSMTKNTTANLRFGMGYIGGIGYQFNNRFGIQIDNLLQVQVAASLQNQTSERFNAQNQELTTSYEVVDKLYSSVGIPGSNVSRIWLIFSF